jgi:hypothetical protein
LLVVRNAIIDISASDSIAEMAANKKEGPYIAIRAFFLMYVENTMY